MYTYTYKHCVILQIHTHTVSRIGLLLRTYRDLSNTHMALLVRMKGSFDTYLQVSTHTHTLMKTLYHLPNVHSLTFARAYTYTYKYTHENTVNLPNTR